MSPLSVTGLPLRIKAPAGASNRMPLNVVPGEKLLVLFRREVVVKINDSPGLGTMPPQLAGVLQLSSVPLPVHVALCAEVRAIIIASVESRAVFIIAGLSQSNAPPVAVMSDVWWTGFLAVITGGPLMERWLNDLFWCVTIHWFDETT